MTAVLALDLGTKLGWAIRHRDGRIESGHHDFSPARGEPEGLRFLRFRAWLYDTKRRLETAGESIAEIRYERVDFIRPGQAYSAHVLGGNWGTVTAWAAHHGIACQGVPVGTIKRAVTGKGNSKKPAIMAAIKAMGFDPRTTDEADALAVLHT